MAGAAWEKREVDLTIDTYFEMLRLELDGTPFSKTAFRQDLLQKIDRSTVRVDPWSTNCKTFLPCSTSSAAYSLLQQQEVRGVLADLDVRGPVGQVGRADPRRHGGLAKDQPIRPVSR